MYSNPKLKGGDRFIFKNGKYFIADACKGDAVCNKFKDGVKCKFQRQYWRCHWLHYCTQCGLANEHTSENCKNGVAMKAYNGKGY